MRSTTLRLVGFLASTTLVSGCANRGEITSPATATGTAGSLAFIGSAATVRVVKRDNPLATAQSASAVIGALGGSLAIPEAGVTVVVPAGALALPTQITVTAVPGNQLAYEFEPHGTRFLVPVVVTQNLSGTSALSAGLLLRPLTAAYFTSISDLDSLAETATVAELLGTSVSLGTKTLTFQVVHFSGYLVATGDEGSESGTSGH